MGLSASGLNAADMDGGKLFEAKCAVCHSMSKPSGQSTVVAPPARGIMFHMGEAFGSKEKIKNHINDFVLAPSKEKAICKSVKRFGLMPSQKGAVSKEELEVIAEWMVENLHMDNKEHQNMEQGKHKGQGKGQGQGKGKGKGKMGQGGCGRG